MRDSNNNLNERHQDSWEDNSLLSELFGMDSIDECPLLRGGMRPLLEKTWTNMLMGEVMKIVSRMMILPPDELNAFAMHWKGYSDRQIGEMLGIDHKTAKKKYLRVQKAIREVSPMGSSKQGSKP